MKTKHRSRRLRRFLRANEAVSALEYAILVGVIAVGVGAALVTFGDNISTALTNLGTDVQTGVDAINQPNLTGGGNGGNAGNN